MNVSGCYMDHTYVCKWYCNDDKVCLKRSIPNIYINTHLVDISFFSFHKVLWKNNLYIYLLLLTSHSLFKFQPSGFYPTTPYKPLWKRPSLLPNCQIQETLVNFYPILPLFCICHIPTLISTRPLSPSLVFAFPIFFILELLFTNLHLKYYIFQWSVLSSLLFPFSLDGLIHIHGFSQHLYMDRFSRPQF